MHRLAPLRPPFLLLTPLCVAVGLAAAVASGSEVAPSDALLCILAGLCAHASVNAFNEHADFASGLDFLTVRTPFSGGSGALPERPELAGWTLGLAWAGTAACVAIGIHFLALRGAPLLLLGAVGLLIVLTYSRFIVRSALGCLVAPGLGFGPVMIVGTALALTGRYEPVAVLASIPVFFVINNLLLLNQFPDREADASVGRRNAVILLGYPGAGLVYTAFVLAAAASLVAGVVLGALPTACLAGLLGLVPCIPAALAAGRYRGHAGTLGAALGLNVAASLATPGLIAAGIALG